MYKAKHASEDDEEAEGEEDEEDEEEGEEEDEEVGRGSHDHVMLCTVIGQIFTPTKIQIGKYFVTPYNIETKLE